MRTEEEHFLRKWWDQGYAQLGEVFRMEFGEWPLKGIEGKDCVGETKVPHVSQHLLNEIMEEAIEDRKGESWIFDMLPKKYQKLLIPLQIKQGGIRDSEIYVFKEMFILRTKTKAFYGLDFLCKLLDSHLSNTFVLQNCISVYGHECIHARHSSYHHNRGFGPPRLINWDLATPYEQKEDEALPRFHSLLAQGYRHWKRLPCDKHEFWAAMTACGLEPPPAIQQKLDDLPDDHAAKTVFSQPVKLNAYGKEKAQWLQRHIDLKTQDDDIGISLDEDVEAFWKNKLLQHISLLFEIYGDEQGRARFGVDSPFDMDEAFQNLVAPEMTPSDVKDAVAFLHKHAQEALQWNSGTIFVGEELFIIEGVNLANVIGNCLAGEIPAPIAQTLLDIGFPRDLEIQLEDERVIRLGDVPSLNTCPTTSGSCLPSLEEAAEENPERMIATSLIIRSDRI